MAETAIRFEDVTKKFNKASYYAADHLSFTIEEGEFITILGSSGCGKTTLLKMVNRLYEPDSGKIILFGGHFYRRCSDSTQTHRLRHSGNRAVSAYDH